METALKIVCKMTFCFNLNSTHPRHVVVMAQFISCFTDCSRDGNTHKLSNPPHQERDHNGILLEDFFSYIKFEAEWINWYGLMDKETTMLHR